MVKKFKEVSVLLMTIPLVMSAGCSTTDRRSPDAYLSDARITARVKALLVEDAIVRGADVQVESDEGVVQLTGFINSELAMIQAVRVTQSVIGVISVRNEMRLK